MAESQYSQTYNSYSGCDMNVTFGNEIIGELQGLSYTVSREVAPIYTMGSANPRSFSRGKRGIAGSLVFIHLDRSPLLEAMKRQNKRYLANRYETYQGQLTAPVNDARQKAITSGTVGSSGLIPVDTNLGNQAIAGTNLITTEKVLAEPWYLDQCPPFNIVVTAGNEFGHMSCLAIYGVQIMNHGQGMSVDDIQLDETCTFVATDIKQWNGQFKFDLQTALGAAPRYDAGFPGARGGV